MKRLQIPKFWNDDTLSSKILAPLAWLYGKIVVLRSQNPKPEKIDIPIICIGNVIIGGAGKTPVAMAIAKILIRDGVNVHFLTRGYKGSLKGPVEVNSKIHNFEDVGDEALLLSKISKTWISHNRYLGADAASKAGAQTIIMDDGFQNSSIFKDSSFLVVDGGYGFGNKKLIPAGPLREKIDHAIKRADAAIIIGKDRRNIIQEIGGKIKIIRGRIRVNKKYHSLKNKNCLAFCGIGMPEKFFSTLESIGVKIKKKYTFPDHHKYSSEEIDQICKAGKNLKAEIITTEKDFMRLPKKPSMKIKTLPITIEWEKKEEVIKLLRK